MSEFELFDDFPDKTPPTLEEDRPVRRKPRRSGCSAAFYNIVTVFFLILTAAAAGIALLFTQEQFVYSSLNPWPPQPPQPTPTLFLLPTPTSTPTFSPPTPLPTTPPPSPTATPTVTLPPLLPGVTPSLEIEETPTVTEEGENGGSQPTEGAYPFMLQDDTVTYTANQNAEGCAWQSIAGQVIGMDGRPIIGLAVLVTGENFEQIEFSGSADEFGPSGYEVWLNNTPLEGEYEVQLLNTTGQPLSEVIIVQTLSACERNVAIANFSQRSAY